MLACMRDTSALRFSRWQTASESLRLQTQVYDTAIRQWRIARGVPSDLYKIFFTINSATSPVVQTLEISPKKKSGVQAVRCAAVESFFHLRHATTRVTPVHCSDRNSPVRCQGRCSFGWYCPSILPSVKTLSEGTNNWTVFSWANSAGQHWF